jgi:hypothetical protein
LVEIPTKEMQTLPSSDSFLSETDVVFSENEKAILPIIKDKLLIVMYMVKSNTPNYHHSSLQNLINNVSNNNALKIFKHNSSTSFSDFIEVLYDTLKTKLQKEINRYRYYGLLVDDSVIIKTNNISIYISYINKDFSVSTSFLGIKKIGPEGATSSHLLQIIKDVLNEWELELKYLISFASDGASNMRGEINGLRTLLLEETGCLLDYYCTLHRLNLVMKYALEEN